MHWHLLSKVRVNWVNGGFARYWVPLILLVWLSPALNAVTTESRQSHQGALVRCSQISFRRKNQGVNGAL